LAHLEALTGLEHLNLAGCNVTDAGLVHLKALKQIHTLYMQRVNVTDAGFETLEEALPNCKIER
jgi:hypothetical protein